MASLFLRGSVYWARVKKDGKWTAVSTGCRDEAGARAFVAGPIAGLTFSDYAATWIENRQTKSIACEKSHINLYLVPYFGTQTMNKIKPQDVLGFVDTLRKQDLAPRTIHNIYSTLRCLFRDAVFAGHVTTNPCSLSKQHLPVKRDKNNEWRNTAIFSKQEAQRLLLETTGIERLFYGLMLYTGCRLGEAAALRWKHLTSETITIANSWDRKETKTGVVRQVPITPAFASFLSEYPRGSENDYVASEGVCQATLHRRWVKTLERLGLRHRRLHDLRRTVVTEALANGVDRDVVRVVIWGTKRTVMDGYITHSQSKVKEEWGKYKLFELFETFNPSCMGEKVGLGKKPLGLKQKGYAVKSNPILDSLFNQLATLSPEHQAILLNLAASLARPQAG